jgi:hypothetical protein
MNTKTLLPPKDSTAANKAAGAGCISRLVRRSSFCYEVRERGISALRVAWMIAEDWKHRKMDGPIPIIKSGAGLWVIKHLESIGIAVEGVQVKAGQVHVRVVTELAYHMVDVSDHPEKLNAGCVCNAVANGDRANGRAGAKCDERNPIGKLVSGLIGRIKAANFNAVLCRIIHRPGNSSTNDIGHPRRGRKPEFKLGRCPPLDVPSC